METAEWILSASSKWDSSVFIFIFICNALPALGEVMLAQDRNLRVSGSGKCLGRLVNCKMRPTAVELVLLMLYTDPG